MPCYLLADNGSVRAAATRQLRLLASQLSAQSGVTVHPVSLMHANRIDPAALDHTPAQIFKDFMRERLQEGERDFVVLPLFFGLSKALTSFIPEQRSRLEAEFGDFQLKIAEVVFPLPKGDARLSKIILDHIQHTIIAKQTPTHAVLVDHGSPIPEVTAVRQALASKVSKRLPEDVHLGQAVMERRAGKAYDFNGSLLADWLHDKAEQGVEQVAVIMMFFLPGKHAGEGGDVADICQSVIDQFPRLKVSISPLVGEHPLLVSLLAERMKTITQA